MDKKIVDIIKDGIIMTISASVVAIFCNYGFSSLKGAGAKADPLVNAVTQSNHPFIEEILSQQSFAANGGAGSLQEYRAERANRGDDFGRTPLMWAAYLNLMDRKTLIEADLKHEASANLLLSAGANPNLRDNDGWTALMWASWSGLTKTADLLIAHGTNIATADKNGQTALMIAAMRGNVDIVKLLLAHGADKSANSKSGQKARDYVASAMRQYPDRKPYYAEINSLL